MNIGKTIETLRKEKCIRQNVLAKYVHVTQKYLSLIESGNIKPQNRTLLRICNVLQIPEPLFYLYSLEETDIPIKKRPAFELVKPALEALIKSLVIE